MGQGGAEGSADGQQHEHLRGVDRQMRTDDQQALDLEVLDDRDSYQHLLKVGTKGTYLLHVAVGWWKPRSFKREN